REVVFRNPHPPLFEGGFADSRDREFGGGSEVHSLDPARITSFSVFYWLFTDAGLVHRHPGDSVARKNLPDRCVLLRERRALEFADFARPQDVTHQLPDPRDPEVASDRDVVADKAEAAEIFPGITRIRVFARDNQVIGKPGARFIEPFELVFLTPNVVIADGGSQLRNVAFESLLDRAIDVSRMAGPQL